MNLHPGERDFLRGVRLALSLTSVCIIVITGTTTSYVWLSAFSVKNNNEKEAAVPASNASVERLVWQPPDSALIPLTSEGELIRYGRELIAHTAKYLGPRGKIRAISNGMNCQNCHLKAGTKPFGNNYAAVVSTYPKFRARSGTMETIEKRINDCIERSLNGRPLENDSREMHAIMAWFHWLGQGVPKGETPWGTGIKTLPFMDRAADPGKGKPVYEQHCASCHGPGGVGYKHPDSIEWQYPPIAGQESYNTGAGLLRLSRLAGYVKYNMPYGTTFDKPVLTDEEAWDVAAYVNSLPRPEKHFVHDWPNVAAKPIDHPFGPYADTFPARQHKYGPFGPIEAARKNRPARSSF